MLAIAIIICTVQTSDEGAHGQRAAALLFGLLLCKLTASAAGTVTDEATPKMT